MIIILSSFVIISALYIGIIVFLRSGLYKLKNDTAKSNLTFSVIIAARNEKEAIAGCLRSVVNQTISQDRFEVIVINDRSTDGTSSIIENIALHHTNMTVLHVTGLDEGVSPKKNALSIGIQSAQNEILLFTDADCVVKPTWLETIDKHFDQQTGVIQGISTYPKQYMKRSLFNGIQALDFHSQGIVSAAGIGTGIPINSNGNNLAIRRKAFDDASGYALHENVMLGDDDLLVQNIWKQKKWNIKYMLDIKGRVETIPPANLIDMVNQRRRWGSVTIHYQVLQRILLSIIFLFYCTLFVLFFVGIVNPFYFLFFGTMFFVKMFGELLLLVPGTNLFKQKYLRSYFVPATLLHLPLVLFSVFAGCFIKVKWK